MTILTVALPDAAAEEVMEHIRRVGGVVTPAVPGTQPSLQLPPLVQLSPEEEAEIDRIIARGGDPVGSVDLARWYEEERDDRPLPGRE